MFNGTNFALNSDLALVSTQVKTLLYIVGQKARESSDTSMSTCDGVRHIPGHWKINKALALLLLIGECSDVASDVGVNLCNVKSCLNTSNNEIFTDKRGDLPCVNIYF